VVQEDEKLIPVLLEALLVLPRHFRLYGTSRASFLSPRTRVALRKSESGLRPHQ
jgi:hypothetical protein